VQGGRDAQRGGDRRLIEAVPGSVNHRLVDGAVVKSGHFLAEENPQATLAALIPVLVANRGNG